MAKVLISVNPSLLGRIDRAAKARGLSRSAYLAELAAKDLEAPAGPGKRDAVREALVDLDGLFRAAPAGEAAAELRSERESR